MYQYSSTKHKHGSIIRTSAARARKANAKDQERKENTLRKKIKIEYQLNFYIPILKIARISQAEVAM